jgi:hypothetical protein
MIADVPHRTGRAEPYLACQPERSREPDAGDGRVAGDDPGSSRRDQPRSCPRGGSCNVIDALHTVLTPDDQLTDRAAAADDDFLTFTVA